MATFIYEAYNSEGDVVHGEYKGTKKEEIVQHLAMRNLTPISVEELHVYGIEHNILSTKFFEHLGPVDIMFLVRNMATTIKAGLSIVDSLDIIMADTENTLMKKILQDTQAMIKNGQQLSAGFEAYKDSFPPVFIGMLKGGELSGQLDRTLTELGHYLSKEYVLRSKVKSAMTYPIILLVASSSVVTLLMIFVIPRLAKSFASNGVQLPLITKILLGFSSILTYSFILDFIIIGLLIYFFIFFRRTSMGKKFFFFVVSHLPVASDLIKKIAVVRFARTFGNLVGSGLSAVESLELSAESVGNQSYVLAIQNVIEDVKNGVAISESIAKFPNLFPRLLISLMAVGERTGSLHDILATFADFYEEEVDNKLKDLTTILEPVLLLIMGLMIGTIAVAILLPIYQLVGNFT